MSTEKIAQEQISALIDNELSEELVDVVLAALRHDKGRDVWEAYHKIGDVLRSDDMAVAMSADFNARLFARLDLEAPIIAPTMSTASDKKTLSHNDITVSNRPMMRQALPRMAAAAALAAIAFIMMPQLMTAMKGESLEAETSVQIGVSNTKLATGATKILPATSAIVTSASAQVDGGVILRDPRMEEYLLAHQRFSPSVYSTAQFARSATFANESKK